MLRRVTLVRTDVSEESFAPIIMVKTISELGSTFTVTSNRCTLQRSTTNVPSSSILIALMMGGDTLLRIVGSYKSHTASYTRRRHCS
jgi:hypothetical protein